MLPAMLWNFRRAAERLAPKADLIHAHWLPSGGIAATLGRPFVVQLWGTDVELARRARPLARSILRRARLTICPSNALADAARDLGAQEVRVIPSGVQVPDEVAEEADPPEVLFAGRLSPEKGILELVRGGQGDEARRRRRRAAAGHGFRARSGSSRTTTSGRCTSGRRSSRARRTARGSASSARRRWPTGGRWSPAPPVGSSTSSWTARPACSFRRATWARCGRRWSGCSRTASFVAGLGAAARERIEERFAWPAVTDATLAAYEEALA